MKPFIFSLSFYNFRKCVLLLQFCKEINNKSGKIIKVEKINKALYQVGAHTGKQLTAVRWSWVF